MAFSRQCCHSAQCCVKTIALLALVIAHRGFSVYHRENSMEATGFLQYHSICLRVQVLFSLIIFFSVEKYISNSTVYCDIMVYVSGLSRYVVNIQWH